MVKFLSLEHCARVTTWNDTRRRLQRSGKTASRTRLVVFLAFNVVVWTLFLVPILVR